MHESSPFLIEPYVLAIPTETVYGLAARIDSDLGLKAIFAIKERPFFDPLIVHIHAIEQARQLVKVWPTAAQVLAEKFWPGPLTLVLEKQSHVSDLITSGLPTVGIRMPNHQLTLALLKEIGVPLAAPSANKFGKTSPTTADHVRAEFGSLVPVLDGGPCQVGVESTVLSIFESQNITKLCLLRPGAISRYQIETALLDRNLKILWEVPSATLSSPGRLEHHYMPSIPLTYVTNTFSSFELKASDAELVLPEQPELAARKLYSTLRELANSGARGIVFFEKKYHLSDHWEAIRDRLTRAASQVLR